MSINDLDPETRDALAAANRAAKRLGQKQVRPEHLLIGLLAGKSLPSTIMLNYGLYEKMVESRLMQLYPNVEPKSGSSLLSEPARQIMAAANSFAAAAGVPSIDTVSLARAVLASNDERIVALLSTSNVTPQTLLATLDASAPLPAQAPQAPQEAAPSEPAAEVAEAAVAGPAAAPSTTGPAPVGGMLAKFGLDLVAAARDGKLDEVIGRDAEVSRVITVLSRRTKNSPCLVGEPGVGKTAIAEGLAARIASGNVPEFLRSRPLVALDLAGMLAGAKLRGDFEERLKKAIAEAVETGTIVFIDELHQILGAGSGTGGLDVANMIKEPLARGQLSVFGATTLDEYRKHIESDAALERRFQPVRVEEPSTADATAMLTQLAPVYGLHHGVTYTAAALTGAVKLADRYITDRFLPDKAIDVLDEAGSAAGMAMMSAPAPLRELYTNRFAARRRAAELTAALTAALHADPPADLPQAQRAELASLAEAEAELTGRIVAEGGRDLGVVDEDRIAAVVASITGVPVSAVGQVETERLKTMADRLGAAVIGQQDAVDVVCRAIRRRRQGISSGARPASFIFAGPTGVGKTQLAKALADDLLGADSADGRGAFIHLDMSEYAEKSATSRLVGAPPGYVGHDSGSHLAEKVRRNPYAVILFDEVEKAHPEVFDTLLAVLEDGRMTDGQGRTVDFSNTILILTSNLGSSVTGTAGIGFGTPESVTSAADRKVREALKEFFRPEFLNRVDDVVVFRPLQRADLTVIVQSLLAPTRTQLADRGITLQVSEAAAAVLIDAGYDVKMGARPLRRAIASLLLDPLSEALLSGSLRPGQVAFADAAGGTITVTPRGQARPAAQPVPATVTADAG